MSGQRWVKVSAASARQKFNGCEPEYIRDVCHGRCCESSVTPSGTMVTIHPSEEALIASLGGIVQNGLLQPNPATRKCVFKNDQHLCGLHGSGAKPFGCIASPFTLNKNDTLIVRNRYRMLKCYNDGRKLPAYIAFRSSLRVIFGDEWTTMIVDHLAAGGGDMQAPIEEIPYRILHDNDHIKQQAKR